MYSDKISIVIPVYNSQDCLVALNEAIEKAMHVFSNYEIIFVNDKSSDSSWTILEQICRVNPKSIAIDLRKNFGQDNALLAGLHKASGTYVVIMDDDLQHNPSDIETLYLKCLQGFDICYAQFSDKQQSIWKNAGSWLNGKLAEKLLKKPSGLYLSPFKIIRHEIIKEVLNFSGPYPYLDATLLAITSQLTQVPVEHHSRFQGKSNYSLKKSILVFINHATNYSIYPLRLVTYIGFAASFIAFVLGIVYTIQYFIDPHRVEGWMTIIILLIFFGGMILTSLGIIGEYIGRIFISINNKPQFTINKIINYESQNKPL